MNIRSLLAVKAVFILSLFPLIALANGTGFLVTSDGYIATNYHVIDGAKEIVVRLKSGKELPAKIARIDQKNDLAVLKVEGSGFKPFIVQSSSDVKRGEKVYAFGFPQTRFQGFEPKLTDGIISSLSGIQDEPTRFQISNSIQPGNSGGPLFTEDGKVVGVVTSTLSTLALVQATGSLPQNINYAVKSNYLIEILRSIDSVKLPSSSHSSFLSIGQKKFTEILSDNEDALVFVQTVIESQQVARKSTSTSSAATQQPPANPQQPPKSPPVTSPQATVQNITAANISKLPPCQGANFQQWTGCVGTHQYPNGNAYTGEYANGLRDGNGFLDITNKSCATSYNCIGSNAHAKYRGQFKADRVSGYGTWVSDNGEKYVGEFQMNMPNGRGTLTTASGVLAGQFKDGKYVGP
jgi:S1-C subfamily serine protease